MRGVPYRLVCILVVSLCGPVFAQQLEIKSFESAGQLSFGQVATAETYCVEWAMSPTGTWRGVGGLSNIAQFANNSYTCTVSSAGPGSKFYRVTAMVTNPVASVPQGMVLIPGGTNAGTDPDFGAYSLTVASFYMDRYEVTKALWDEVKNWNGGNGYGYDNAGLGKAANHPVHTVNWYDVVKWCNARSQREGRTPVYYTDAGFTHVYKTGQVLEPYVNASAIGALVGTMIAAG